MIKNSGLVRGIAVLNKFIYVICKSSKEIDVYAIEERFERGKSVTVNQLKTPWCLAACSAHHCLYISEFDNQEEAKVYKVNVDRDEVSSWTISKEYRRSWVRVSVTPNPSVIVSGWLSLKLEEYNMNGGKLRVIDFSNEPGIFHVQHAVQRRDGTIVLIHGWSDDLKHRVCLLDPTEGKLVKYYGESMSELNTPIDVTVSDSGEIFVIDSSNRLLVLDPTMELARNINLQSEPWKKPGRFCMGDTSNEFYVSEESVDGIIVKINLRL